ncbi:MAG: HD domain-containing protein [Candidatus Cloacimonetes bacterium]|nr:HD domain-containing protein [Candidatus Cloacimonadota bacterium]
MEIICKDIRNWFNMYVQDFAEGADRHNIILKIEHSQRVVADIIAIGKALGLSGDKLYLAEIIGILHDVGRFEQYKRYGTYSDAKSLDHAKFGVGIIREKKILLEMPERERELVIKAVLYHNRLRLPVDEQPEILFFSRLLRDADKLDIFKVVTDYYAERHLGRNETLELDLPEAGEVSEIVYQAVAGRKEVDFKQIRNLNDFKMLQAGWVYDLNFVPAIRFFRERGYLAKLKAALPANERTAEIFLKIDAYIDQKLADGSPA